ncbi:family 43 glycosylhydrolase [Furfurilactobacillus rossiae]|uniref:Beta-xylosidase n=1 Tax=Furfurilactobacillus rossiae DSM 15814 TaxID=1114972 RepID=A0A0R1RAK8_9LACO|nr:family 43 glycosylhydrolase [Furfurilactobacillus rossiae]KRL53697.1 Beta-xylosidase [Furfurilactobacillus rossiae DSM 15814]QFR67690.1 family 43 glycosylhydrolase [Furfurilactobacillus rossiae]QLE60655.1 Beta-xylosidase [Furfurilactobacillus rossiae]
MSIIHNPIISGMAPDPSIIRVGGDYYIATSTFHWNPAIQIFHSTNLANWGLLTQVLKHDEVNLRGTNTPAGIWAPHLSFDKKTNKYWLAYSHMQNMAGREFNADSFAMWADDIKGPWSKPIYLTSIGFDPSLFHDQDGRHYLSILEWESRVGYQAPGHIVIAEVDLNNGNIIGGWHSVTTGFTTRGCVEAPQLYRHNDYYYLMLASGGTGYAHGIEMGRSKNIFGPYEPNPTNEPILTSSPHHLFSLGDPDAGHFEMYNPLSKIQKAGHGSLVQTPEDEWYIAHLMSRPLPNTKLNPLGRETGLQKMVWDSRGWLTMVDGSNLAKSTVESPKSVQIAEQKPADSDVQDDFHEVTFDNHFMTPYRMQASSWVNTAESPNHLRIYGGNSFFSQVNPSIMATRATSLNYTVQTSIEFQPHHFSQSAGLGLYYDANNWLYARICPSEKEDSRVLRILQAKLGERHDYKFSEVSIPEGPLQLKLIYHSGNVLFQYQSNGSKCWSTIREAFDATYLSDEGVNGEPGEIGGFTGLFNFIGATDAFQHKSFADFEYYKVSNLDNSIIERIIEKADK